MKKKFLCWFLGHKLVFVKKLDRFKVVNKCSRCNYHFEVEQGIGVITFKDVTSKYETL